MSQHEVAIEILEEGIKAEQNEMFHADRIIASAFSTDASKGTARADRHRAGKRIQSIQLTISELQS